MIIFCICIFNVKVTPLLIVWFSQWKKITYVANSTSRFKIIKRHERIKVLQTPYPLGFNDNKYHEGNILKMPDFDVFSLLCFVNVPLDHMELRKMEIINAKVVLKN